MEITGHAQDQERFISIEELAALVSAESILRGFDVLYADIGGLSGPDGILESLSLIDGLSYALEPRCIVIKSLCMRRLASSLRAYSDVWEKNQK